MKIKQEHIENHFISNPHWKTYFLSKFLEWTPKTWEEDVWSLFEINGYKYEIEMYKGINAIKYITLFDSNGEDIAQMRDQSTSYGLTAILIHVICDHIVDFKTFK